MNGVCARLPRRARQDGACSGQSAVGRRVVYKLVVGQYVEIIAIHVANVDIIVIVSQWRLKIVIPIWNRSDNSAIPVIIFFLFSPIN